MNLSVTRWFSLRRRLLALERAGLPVHEYATRLVKKAIVGTGGAGKAPIQAMLGVLLPGAKLAGALHTPGNQLRFTFGEEREVPVGGDAITLITCDGDFTPATQEYNSRTVVRATRT